MSFDARDFDETLPGPFEWDIKRVQDNHGARVINGKRQAQSATDIFVG